MNKLQRDQNRLRLGTHSVLVCFLVLGMLKIVQLGLGLKEREFYVQYPIGWYVAAAFGLGFVLSLLYSIQKAMSVDPSIQLRSKSIDFLKEVLADPEYRQWHSVAKMLMDQKLNDKPF